jgi:hypothetical protein
MQGDWGGCGVSANEFSWAHHVKRGAKINFGDLSPYLTNENPAWPLKVVRKSERRTSSALASRTRVVRLKARLLKSMQKIRGGDHRGLRLEDRTGSASGPVQQKSCGV